MANIETPRYKMIACEIMFREICFCASKCVPIVDITFMRKGLHDIGEQQMNALLQKELDAVDTEKYDAILLCYGLCNNGIRNLSAKLPIVAPRAHDCITLLLGSKERYTEYFNDNPGTFFESPGWVERNSNTNEDENSVMNQLGINKTYEEYLEMYGEENAEYLAEMLGDMLHNYSQLTYIDTGTGNFDEYKKLSKSLAEEKSWKYDEIQGDIRLIMKLMNGEWDNKEFLIVPPHRHIMPSNKEDIILFE